MGYRMNINTVIFRIALIVLIVEALTMEMISVMPIKMSPLFETFVDAVSLVLFTTPIIYFWVIKPFIIMKNKAMDKAACLAFHDVLTGLPNRPKFFEWLESCPSGCFRKSYECCTYFIGFGSF